MPLILLEPTSMGQVNQLVAGYAGWVAITQLRNMHERSPSGMALSIQ